MPESISQALGEPALVHGESQEAYKRAVAEVAADVKPCGIIEWLLVQQLVDTQWQIARARRAVAAAIALSRKDAFRSFLMATRSEGVWKDYVAERLRSATTNPAAVIEAEFE